MAIVAFLESDNYETTIKNAISYGSDSDTIADMAGAVAEAFYGINEELKETTLSYLDETLLDIVERFESKYLEEIDE